MVAAGQHGTAHAGGRWFWAHQPSTQIHEITFRSLLATGWLPLAKLFFNPAVTNILLYCMSITEPQDAHTRFVL